MTLNERILDLYNQGLSYPEIAAELKVTYTTVSMRLFRMRKRGKTIPYRIAVWDRQARKEEGVAPALQR